MCLLSGIWIASSMRNMTCTHHHVYPDNVSTLLNDLVIWNLWRQCRNEVGLPCGYLQHCTPLVQQMSLGTGKTSLWKMKKIKFLCYTLPLVIDVYASLDTVMIPQLLSCWEWTDFNRNRCNSKPFKDVVNQRNHCEQVVKHATEGIHPVFESPGHLLPQVLHRRTCG